MVFCGDIALPADGVIAVTGLPDRLLRQQWIGNLEGSLVDCDDTRREALLKRHIVFNDSNAVRTICSSIPFVAFNLANNHILDAAPITETIGLLKESGKAWIGAGNNIGEAAAGLVSGDFVIMSFGWNAINCIYATETKAGVNPYVRKHLFSLFSKIKTKYPSKKIICLFHWNYELELYPQPLDREIAHELIEKGAYAVIGCHAHRVQTVEYYKDRPIVYGMGNFAFPHSVYMNGKLKFPEFTSTEYVVELDADGVTIHELSFDIESGIVRYVGEVSAIANPFDGMDNSDYEKWFKRNRYQKKALPVMKFSDGGIIYSLKIKWIAARNVMTRILSDYAKVNSLIKRFLSRIYD